MVMFYDPKALLNPKKAGQEKASKQRRNFAGPAQSRKPVMANSAAETNSQGLSANGHQDPTDDSPGMGSMIERQYGVSNRAAPPAKKRKVDGAEDGSSDDGDKKSRSKFNGASSNGILGQHIREEREKAAATTGPPQIVDLTDDNDNDEIQITGSNILQKSSKLTAEDTMEVCLGMLHAQANVHKIPRYPKALQGVLGKGRYPQMRVHEKRTANQTTIIGLFDRSTTGDHTGIKFGNLEVKVAAVLCPLLDCEEINGLKIKVYLDGTNKLPGEFEGSRTSRLMALRILLFAPKHKAVGIGKVLSQKGLYLETPAGLPVPRDLVIFNPHIPTVLGPSKRAKNMQPAYGVVRTQEEMLRATESMFDSLVKTVEIPEMEADSTVFKTELQGLQKQALHFMTQHERVDSDDVQLPLWKQRESAKGTIWANVITNHELLHSPEPVRGGILADEMGLGKTLSILSLTAATRAEAAEFGEDEPAIDLEEIARNAKATLVICPKSVMSNWTQQIKEHIKGRQIKVYQYHGSDRTQDLDELAKYDIVLVPYGTVSAEYALKNGRRNALTSINWFRIVLDEAHSIRTSSTQVSKACCALTAQRRWAVTGTPVQNRLDDLGTLIKFLRIQPFNDEVSWNKHIIAPFKMADENVLQHLQLLVASVTLRRTKDTVNLPDKEVLKVTLNFSDGERAMYAQFSGQANLQVKAMTKGNDRIRGKGYAFMLRSIHRLRSICAHGQEMLNEDDMKELEGLTAQTAIDLGDEPDKDGNPDSTFITESQAYDFLHMLIESTSAMCEGCGKEITKKKESNGEDSSPESDDEDSDDESEDEEDVDWDALEKDILGYINPCYDHLFCPGCKDNFVRDAKTNQRTDGYHNCLFCGGYVRFGLFELRRSTLESYLEAKSLKAKKERSKWDEGTYSGPHTKVKALINDLKQSAQESKTLYPGQPPIKSVVFSGWTTYLDLIEYALDQHAIKYTRLDGSMSIKKRTAVLKEFAEDDDITVILVSIKAGGQGLNLTAASRVYMMEPQFNPGVEQQAIDRVHRMGQKRDVVIKHMIMKDSIEERIQVMQKRKQQLAELAMDNKSSKGAAAKQRLQDLVDLFK